MKSNGHISPAAGSRINRRLLLGCLAIGVGGALLFSALQYFIQYDQKVQQLRASLETTARVFEPSLVRSVWSLDAVQINLQMRGLTTLPDVTSASLILEEGDEYREGTVVTSDQAIKSILPLYHEAGTTRHYLGALTLFNDMEGARAALLRDNAFHFTSIALVILVIALSVGILYNRMVTRRILDLARTVRDLSVDDIRMQPNWEPDTQVKTSRDEIDELVNSIWKLRKTGHDALRTIDEREQRFRDFTRSTSDWLWEMDSELRFSYVSEEFDSITGMRGADSIGKTRMETRPQNIDENLWNAHVADLLAHAPFKNFTYSLKSDSGRVRHVVIGGVPRFDDNGDFIGYRGTGSDITDQVLAEQRLRIALDSIADGFVLYDSDDRLAICNERYREFYAASAPAIVPGATFEDIIRYGVRHNQYAAAVGREEEFVRERLAVHHNPGGEIEQELSDGRWLRIREEITRDGSRVGLRTDITTLKQAELVLRQSQEELENRVLERTRDLEESREKTERSLAISRVNEERFRSVVENAGDAIFILGSDGHILDANPIARRLTGYNLGELQSRPFCTLVSTQARPSLSATLDEAENSPESFPRSLETECERRRVENEGIDVARFLAEMQISLIPSSNSDHLFLVTVRDITDRKNAERELTEAKEAAEAANYSKTAFLANMSHEIRTPMNGVVGMIDLLMQMDQPPEQRRMIQTIRNSSFSLLRIIDDILDATKIDVGKMKLESVPVRLLSLVEGAVSGFVPLADTNRVQLRLFFDSSLPAWIEADPVRLRQVLTNLIGNAVKFSRPESEGEIGRVSLTVQRDPNGRLLITVADNGIGMTDGTIQRLFQPFTQGEESTTRQFGGTGLGLVIIDNLVGLMDGEISVESTPGEGSTFTVLLPLKELNRADPEPDITGVNVHVLFDENMVPGAIDSWLVNRGVTIHWHHSPEELFAQIATDESHPLVILGYKTDQENAEIRHRILEINPDISCLVATYERSVPLGLLEPNHFVIQRLPLLPSELRMGLAVLAGRATPDITQGIEERGRIEIASEASQDSLILLVEDNETNQDVIIQQVQLLGYRIGLAENGQQGLEKWRSGRFDLILADCHMPVMDGFEMTAAIREEERASDSAPTPIIAITANALHGEADRCIGAGMNDYLSKPVELARLSHALKRWLPGETPPPEPALEPVVKQPARNEPESSAPPPVDPSAMIAVFGAEDPFLFSQMMRSFVQKSQPDIEGLRSALETGSNETVRELAHKLKSSSRTIGANGLADLCERIEFQAKDEKLIDPPTLGQELIRQFDQTTNFIEHYGVD